MRFTINRVSTGVWNHREPACPGAVLGEVPGRPDLSPTSFIEVSTLEELLALGEALKESIIVDLNGWVAGVPNLRILDDYL